MLHPTQLVTNVVAWLGMCVWVINGVAQLCFGSVIAWLTVRTASTHHLPLTGGCTQVQWRVIMHLPLSSGLRETFEKVCVPLRSKSVFGPVTILNKNCWSAYKQWDKETLRKVLQRTFKSLIEGEPENCGSHQERHQTRWTPSGQQPSPSHHGLELHPHPTLHSPYTATIESHTLHNLISVFATRCRITRHSLWHYCDNQTYLLMLWECAPIGVDQKAEWVAWDPG